jgi:hypothetical protein
MDILVTTPKEEIDNAKKEGEEVQEDIDKGQNAFWFRVFHYRPKVEIGDKIYFVESSMITGYGVIFNIEQIFDPESQSVCDTTDRVWGKEGDWQVQYRDWHWLKEKVPHKGFQNIRYIAKNPELAAKLSGIPAGKQFSKIVKDSGINF